MGFIARIQTNIVIISFRFKMFEPNMDEYLDEEVEVLKQAFEMTCRTWEKQVSGRFYLQTFLL